VEIGADGEALCALRTRATAYGCEQAGHIFGHTWVGGKRGSAHNVLCPSREMGNRSFRPAVSVKIVVASVMRQPDAVRVRS